MNLSISDSLNNGKDAAGFIDFDMHSHVHECKIRSGLLYINDALVDLNKIKSIILNFNEEWSDVIPFFKKIVKLI